MLHCPTRAVTTPTITINQLMHQLTHYPYLTIQQKFTLGISIGLCVSKYLVQQNHTATNKFDILFIWLLKNKISITSNLLKYMQALQIDLECSPFDETQHSENLIDLAIYRLHNLLAVSNVIHTNMSLCLKLQTELHGLVQLIKKKQHEYSHNPQDLNYTLLSNLLVGSPEHNNVGFASLLEKINHDINTHVVNDKKISEWVNDLNQLRDTLDKIITQYPNHFCLTFSPFCVTSRKQPLNKFFTILKEKVEFFIQLCNDDVLPVNKYPFCI